MRRTAIGLDIGSSSLRAAQVSFHRDGVQLERISQVGLPEGAVVNGEVVDAAALTDAVRLLWKQARFGSKRVALGVANQRVLVRQVELPPLSPADLKAALPFQVQEHLPMPADAAVLDFLPLAPVSGPNGTALVRGLLVAAPRDMVTTTVDAVQAAGLVVDTVDLTPFAVLRATRAPRDLDLEALVDIGARLTTVIVHSAGTPRFVRILLSGGDDITAAVSEAAAVPFAEAERLKRAAAGGDLVSPAVGAALSMSAQELVDEIRSSLDYDTATGGSVASRVVIVGGGSQLEGFAERLEEATGRDVVRGDGLRGLRQRPGKKDLPPLSASDAASVGLALGGSR